MGDTYREILIKSETPLIKRLFKTGLPVLAVVCLLGGVIFWPLLIGAVVFGLLSFFVAPRMEIEYEYLYINGELDIDVIYSRQKRKNAGRYKLEEMELLAPERSHALDAWLNHPGTKWKDFTSRQAPDRSYVLVLSHEGELQIIKIELDEETLNEIRRIAPRKVSVV